MRIQNKKPKDDKKGKKTKTNTMTSKMEPLMPQVLVS